MPSSPRSAISSHAASIIASRTLFGTPVTLDQVDALAEWVRGFGKRITGVYITHGHQDHWIGLARLQEHFPEARRIATPEVVRRATFEATDPGLPAYWKASFPGELPQTAVLPEALTTGRVRAARPRAPGGFPSARETPSSPRSCMCRPPPPRSAVTSSTTACT
jgi:glyoxylase-like metal-dependent hydrolase (beta-lactamase superfamily II)